MLSQRRARDEGFTLIELVVSVSILAIISVALIGMLLGYLKNANATGTRLNESSDQQFVAAYWQNDVSSLGMHGALAAGSVPVQQSIWTTGGAPAGVPSGCSSIAGTVIGFVWNDYPAGASDETTAWTPKAVSTVYWTQAAGSQTQLWRTRCSGSATPYSTIVARYLSAPPTVGCTNQTGGSVACTATSPSLPANVSITLVVRDLSQGVLAPTGYTTTLTAQRRQG